MSLIQDPSTSTAVNVKAANTPPVASDQALVVTVSPNSGAPIINTQTLESTAAWTSATAGNTALSINVDGYSTIAITLNPPATLTGGVVTFEISDTVAGTNWYTLSVAATDGGVYGSSYTLVASTNIAFQMNVAGFVLFRVRLSTVITGSGTTNIGIAAQASASKWSQFVQGINQIGAAPTANPIIQAYLDSNGNVRYPTTNVVAGGGFGGPTTYSNVVTDLEGFRDDFQGTNLIQNITGTCTFTNGSATVTGSGTSFISALNTADIYVRLSTDPNSDFTKLLIQPYYEATNGNTILQLASTYPGSSGSGTGVWTYWAPTIGSGGSIVEGTSPAAASQVALETGTTNGSYTYLQHGTHFIAPCNITVYASVSQAIANQEFAIGLVDNITSPGFQCLLIFNGTNNTQVTLRTGTPAINGGSAAIENEVGTLPNSLTTATQIRYRIVASEDAVILFANDIPIIRNKLHLPTLYNPQPLTIAAYNTGVPGGSTNLIVDMISITSHDKVEVEMATTPQPAPAQISGFDISGNYQQASVVGTGTIPGTTTSALVVAISPNSVDTAQGSTATGSTLSGNPFVSAGLNSQGYVESISTTLISGLENMNVSDVPSQNKLDLIYQKLDELVNIFYNTVTVQTAKQLPVRAVGTIQYSFTASTSATFMLSNNVNRVGATFENDIGSTGNLYLLLGASPSNVTSATNYSVMLIPGAYYELPFGFCGVVGGLSTTATGNIYVTEIVNNI